MKTFLSITIAVLCAAMVSCSTSKKVSYSKTETKKDSVHTKKQDSSYYSKDTTSKTSTKETTNTGVTIETNDTATIYLGEDSIVVETGNDPKPKPKKPGKVIKVPPGTKVTITEGTSTETTTETSGSVDQGHSNKGEKVDVSTNEKKSEGNKQIKRPSLIAVICTWALVAIFIIVIILLVWRHFKRKAKALI